MRIRWLRNLKQLWLGLFATFALPVVVRASQKSWRLLALASVCLVMLWWTRAREDMLCDGHQVQEQICAEYTIRQIAGNLCYDFCVTKAYRLSGCGSLAKQGHGRTFQVVSKGQFLPGTLAMVAESVPDLQLGASYHEFKAMVKDVLVQHLDNTSEMDILIAQLLDEFDVNRNAMLSYGEAQTLWRQIHQPSFLNNYIFQYTGAVARLNGTCGGLSMWHMAQPSPYLYNGRALWLLSFIYPKVYRFTLPTWPKRAKVVLSLLELSEHLMESYGARFHLCNVSSYSLLHDKHNEILVSDTAQLLSSQQIKRSLSNRSCHHDHDCFFSRHCQTVCHTATQTCSGQLVRPTVAPICDIIQDYLVFDAPKTIRHTLMRRVRRCQGLLWSSSPLFSVRHSVLVLDIKAMLWRQIQDLKL